MPNTFQELPYSQKGSDGVVLSVLTSEQEGAGFGPVLPESSWVSSTVLFFS